MKLLKTSAVSSACLITALGTLSCTSIKPETSTSARTVPGVPGGTYVETQKITATVTAINAAKREATFVTPDSKAFSIVARPEVKNFDQIKVGDQLSVTTTTTLEVRMAKPGEILISDRTFQELSGEMNTEALPRIAVKGVDEPIKIYKVTR